MKETSLLRACIPVPAGFLRTKETSVLRTNPVAFLIREVLLYTTPHC